MDTFSKFNYKTSCSKNHDDISKDDEPHTPQSPHLRKPGEYDVYRIKAMHFRESSSFSKFTHFQDSAIFLPFILSLLPFHWHLP